LAYCFLKVVFVFKTGVRGCKFYGPPSLFDRIEFRRVAWKLEEAYAVRFAPLEKKARAVPWRAVQKQEQARVTCLQALYERQNAARVYFLQERIVFAPAVHDADAVKFFARKTRFGYCRFAAGKPASHEVRR